MSVDCGSLAHDEYTVVCELFPHWNINTQLNIQSTSINIKKQISRNFTDYNKYIIHMHKYSDHGVLYIDVDFDKKHDVAADYNNEWMPCYLILYGVIGYVENVDSDVYDSFMYFENDEINFEKSIDMNDNLIIGVKNADRDKAAVNLKQVTDLLNNHSFALISQINTKQNKSNYQLIFEYFFDLLDPDSFDMENTYGSNIESVGGKLILKNSISLIKYKPKEGFSIDKSHIQLDNILDQNSDFTLFVSFLHDNSLTGQNYSIGFADMMIQIMFHNIM